jgi:hypothetical protein
MMGGHELGRLEYLLEAGFAIPRLEVGNWVRYRLGAFNAPGQSTPHQHHNAHLTKRVITPRL